LSEQGKVYLVGAGPGDPGLITAKGLQCLQEAQVVLYDRLVDQRLLGEASPEAEMLDVGKARGFHREPQEGINQLMVEKALEGKRVVRLKGGDPFIFGRGGEEAEALAKAGVPFEIVPGVTSAIAAPAYAGIPLTHRRVSSSVTIVSGSEDPTKGESTVDWKRLAGSNGTIAVLMGWETLPGIVETLMQHGMDASTPAALVQWGTEPHQKTVAGCLEDIVEKGREAGLAAPVVAVFGQVVNLRDRIGWFEERPLLGKRVLVPRTREQAGTLSKLLLEQGADPVEIPTIKVEPVEDTASLDAALKSLSNYDWVVFASVNGVAQAFNRLRDLEMDARAFSGARVCAIGSATAAALGERGIIADYVPQTAVSEAIVAGLGETELAGKSVLLLRAEVGRDVLLGGLSERGARVDDVAVYRTVVPEESREAIQDLVSGGKLDVVTFTSSSTVTNLIALLGGDVAPLKGVKLACIGPITAQTAMDAGLEVDVVARKSTTAGLVDALVEHISLSGA
jgi:uroporphyrinogen III methyltransferase/synthase